MRRTKTYWDQKRGVWQPRISEEMVLKEIVTRLWLQARIRVVRINCPVGGKVKPNEPGIPDLIGWFRREVTGYGLAATPLFIEVKRPGGARRAAQIQFIEEAKQAGCAAFFAESFEDCIRELAHFGVKIIDPFYVHDRAGQGRI